MSEQADVVVVGGRLAGCALAAPLARAGRRVVVIDRMTFPSDQLSTHLLMASGTAEIARMGALPRILALNPSRVRWLQAVAEDSVAVERLRPSEEGIDFGLCIPRDQQDVCLVEAAREQGADIRERCTFDSLIWRAGRVAGLRYRDADGAAHEVHAKLTVGADGRRSNVAAAVGAWTPYRMSLNGRGLVFRYVDDPQAGTQAATTYFQWREGESIAFAFPSCPEGRLLILFMGHKDETSEARRDPEAHWARKVAEHPGIAARLRDADPSTYTKIRSTADTPAFFRASSGPGWALAGDAAHFKDPVTGQGMRDAMWMGRTLAEHVLPVLDDPAAIDVATRRWEATRDEHCLPAYHFANMDTRVEVQSSVVCELVRDAGRTEAPDLGDVFGRARTLQQIAPLPRLARATALALARGERPRLETVVRGTDELRTQLEIRRERLQGRFRSTRPVHGSDHPGATWAAPPAAPPATARSGHDDVPVTAAAPSPQEVPA